MLQFAVNLKKNSDAEMRKVRHFIEKIQLEIYFFKENIIDLSDRQSVYQTCRPITRKVHEMTATVPFRKKAL